MGRGGGTAGERKSSLSMKLCKASRREGASTSASVCVDQGLAIVQSL